MPASGIPAPGVTVRRAVPGDLPALVALLDQGSLTPGREDLSALEPYRAALDEVGAGPGPGVLVAEAGGEVVGMCQVVVFRHLQARGGRCAEIESVHVRGDHRGRGVGGVLLEAAVAAAAQAGCYRVQLTSNTARDRAHRFYERHGFVPSHVGYKRLLP